MVSVVYMDGLAMTLCGKYITTVLAISAYTWKIVVRTPRLVLLSLQNESWCFFNKGSQLYDIVISLNWFFIGNTVPYFAL